MNSLLRVRSTRNIYRKRILLIKVQSTVILIFKIIRNLSCIWNVGIIKKISLCLLFLTIPVIYFSNSPFHDFSINASLFLTAKTRWKYAWTYVSAINIFCVKYFGALHLIPDMITNCYKDYRCSAPWQK